jgi:hypothetical protein
VGDGLVSAIEYCNSEMLRGLSIPQTLFAGTGSGGSGGSLALSETHERTFGETVDRVGRSLEDCMDEQVIRPLIEWNWPSVQVEEMPHFRFEPYQAEDGMAALERLEKAKGMGAALMLDAVYEAAGAERPPEDAPEEDVIGGKSASAPEIGEPMEPGKIPPQLAPFVGKRPVGQGPEDGTGFPFRDGRTTFEEAVREVNEFERKVNFGEIRAKTDGMIAAYLEEATKLANEIRQTAVEVVDEKLGKGGAE